MTAHIRWFWSRLNANYWFYPALFAIVAAALAFGMIWLDRNGFAEWLNDVEWLTPARPEGASNMLNVISGSMIAVASTVFSITIVAVSYASGTYGPRLLTNFMEDKGNQLSLATFIGTFVYAITVLRAVRAENEEAATLEVAAATDLPGFVPQLSLLVAYLLMALSVAVLVFFLNHIPSSIRINNVLKEIGRGLLVGIGETYPEKGGGEEDQHRPQGVPLYAQRAGYVQLIDFDELMKLARDAGCEVVLQVRTGDFVHAGMELAQICGRAIDDEVAADIRSQFNLGASRTPKQDPDFLIDELVEIGLRALSPGINDPFTAINALHWLGAATAELGSRRLDKTIQLAGDGDQPCPVHPLPDGFRHYLQRGMGAIRSAVATSAPAAKVMLDVLRNAAAPLEDESRKTLLRQEGQRLVEQARLALRGPDLEELEARYASFSQTFA